MSTRLTNDIRERVGLDVLVHRFRPDVDALLHDQSAFALRVYDDLFDVKTQAAMHALPEGWLPAAESIGAQFGYHGGNGRFVRLYFSGYVYGDLSRVRDKSDNAIVVRRVPASKEHGCAKVYDSSHKLSIEFDRIRDRTKKIRENIATAKQSVTAALAAVTTVKRLIETWPEIAPFASKYETEKPQLPALPTHQLNSILDLPVDEAEAA